MRLTPRTAIRAWALAALLAIVPALSACGDDETKVAGAGEGRAKTEGRATAAARPPCGGQMDALLDSLDRLRGRLAVGLSYEMYLDEVQDARQIYDAIRPDRLLADCIVAVGTPSERALNRYIEAANTWGKCLSDLYCASSSVEPQLQHKWRIASSRLSEAHLGARGVQAR